MACKNSLFRVLKDQAGNLLGLTGIASGEAITTQIAALVAAFKDSDGNAVFPTLNADGQIPVALDAGDCYQSGAGSLAGTDTMTKITNSDITLAVDTDYYKVEGVVSSMVESCFQIVALDDSTETVLAEVMVGPGQYTVPFQFNCMRFTTGATGTQELYIKGQNATDDDPADLKAYITILGPNA